MQTFRCLFLSLIATASVPAVTVVVNPNPVVSTSAITDGITGADMTGLFMTATYNTPGGPTTVSATWAATGPASGKAAAPGNVTVVSLTGDTGANLAWQYTAMFLSPLLEITFDGTAAGIYFDRTHVGPGTPGTGPGADIVFGPIFGSPAIQVTYSSAVVPGGSAWVGDLYAKMTLDFAGSGLSPQDFAFTQDTDRGTAIQSAGST